MAKIVWLVSYPRSGNTWLRFLLSNVQHPDKRIGYSEVDIFAPDIYRSSDAHKFSYGWSPVFVKSHDQWREEYDKVIYLYRDVRDVLVSCFFYEIWKQSSVKDESELMFADFFERFVVGDVEFGSWKEHIEFWLCKKVDKFMLSYEEIEADAENALLRIFDFAEINAGRSEAKRAAEKSKYSKLMERGYIEEIHPYKIGVRGCSGGWSGFLNQDQKERIWEWAGGTLRKLGYNAE